MVIVHLTPPIWTELSAWQAHPANSSYWLHSSQGSLPQTTLSWISRRIALRTTMRTPSSKWPQQVETAQPLSKTRSFLFYTLDLVRSITEDWEVAPQIILWKVCLTRGSSKLQMHRFKWMMWVITTLTNREPKMMKNTCLMSLRRVSTSSECHW